MLSIMLAGLQCCVSVLVCMLICFGGPIARNNSAEELSTSRSSETSSSASDSRRMKVRRCKAGGRKRRVRRKQRGSAERKESPARNEWNPTKEGFPPPPSASEEDDTINECKSNWGREMPYIKGKGRKLRLKKRRKTAECLPEAPPEHLPFCCDDCDPSREKDTQKMDDPGCIQLLEGPNHPLQAFKDAIDKYGSAWGGMQDIFCHYPERSTQIDSLRGNANAKLSKEDEAPQSIESCYMDPAFREQTPKEQFGEIKQSTLQKDSKERVRLGLSLEKVQPDGSKEKLDRPDSKEKVAPNQMKNKQVIKHGHSKSLECTMSDSEDIPFMRAELRKYPKKKHGRCIVQKGPIEYEGGKSSKQGQASKSRESVTPGVRPIKSPEILIARDFNNMKLMKRKPRFHRSPRSQNGKFPRDRDRAHTHEKLVLNKLKGMTGQESEGSQEETEESDLSGSSIWASESHPTHSASSGDEDDVDSDTDVEGITSKSSSSGFEIGSPVFVDVPNSSDEESEQGDNGRSLRDSSASQKTTQTRKKLRAHRGYKHTYTDSGVQSLEIMSSENEKVDAKPNNAPVSDVRKDSRAVFTEIPSPERPFLRPPSATAKELMEIHKNYRRGSHQEWPVLLPPNMDEDLQNLDHSDPAKRPRYLPLAPPYHLLPNTSFFRKTAIKPPPTYCSDGLPPLKRIMNRYLASILIDHMKSEEELRVFIQERKRQIRRENQGREGELKEHGETDGEGDRTQAEDPSRNAHHRQKRKPRVVIQHLLYGGQLIHYIQDGGEPPPIPGYFTSAPLIPSNVRITRELNGSAPTEYQQLRTSQGIQFVPLGQPAEEMCTVEQPAGFPAEGSCRVVMSPPIRSPSPSPPASEAEEVREGAAEAGSEFSIVAMERFASVSITSNVLNVKFAERRVSICRSPQQ